ncbi:MAG: hypothetical protein MUC57_08180 [Desulfobacterales bacterium]|nr:hypothetical protein [Desulfobacterales bacterium]
MADGHPTGDRDAATVDPRADACPPGIIINEVQLILAEKRTSLASLRTGIAVFAIPLSIMGVAIAKLRREDRMIAEIKRKHSVIAEFID